VLTSIKEPLAGVWVNLPSSSVTGTVSLSFRANVMSSTNYRGMATTASDVAAMLSKRMKLTEAQLILHGNR
jgi:hypothetical protein